MKNTEKIKGEKYPFESLVSVFLLLAFVLVGITGILSFSRLNRIIFTVNKNMHPDYELILVKDIYSDLIQAENFVKSYTLTGNKDDMTSFYALTDLTGIKMDELEGLVRDDEEMSAYISTLDTLVEKKFDILDRLLMNQDESLVKKAMDEVMQNLSERETVPRVDTAEIPAIDTVPVPETVTTPVTQKKDNFFTRLFRKKNKQQEEIQDTTSLPVTDTVNQAKTGAEAEAETGPEKGLVAVEKINRQVEKVRKSAIAAEKLQRQQELDLFRQDRAVMEKIRKVLNDFETYESRNTRMNTLMAEKQAAQVKVILLSFGIASLLLLLLAGTTIFIYIKRNNEYRFILKKARTDAEELARARERFLANMSHEVKTPMNIISGYLAQIMQSPLDDEQSKQIGIVKESADHLLQLLNNLLDLSKLQANKLELAETNYNPAGLVRNMQLWFTRLAGEKNIRLETEIAADFPEAATGDPVRMRQILFNLIGNAIKFTEQGSVTIRARLKEETGGKRFMVFEVADTGIGIPKEEIGKIFGEFEQGSGSQARRIEGTGLGLAITARLVELAGGTIKAESVPGRGSTFRVILPFVPAGEIIQSKPEPTIPGREILNGLNVLVVDDEKYNRNLLKLILVRYGCNILEAADGEEAIAMAEKNAIDIILMDIRMPRMNGPEAAEKIKQSHGEKVLPVIAVSAAGSQEISTGNLARSFDAFLSKPFHEDELIKTIISLIKDNKSPGHPVLFSDKPKVETSERQARTATPAYDLGPLRESCMGNDKFFHEMVEMFLENTAAGLNQMETLAAKGNWKDAASIAHKISAPCKHVRAEKLYSLLKQAEEQLDKKDPGKTALQLIQKSRKEFEKIRAGILAGPEFS